MRLIRIIFPFIAVFTFQSSYAQKKTQDLQKHMVDSIKMEYLTEAAIRNPLFRQVVVSNEIVGPGNLRNFLYGQRYFDAEASLMRTTALISVPIISWGKNSVTTSLIVSRQQYDFLEVTPYSNIQHPSRNTGVARTSVGFTSSFTRVDSLFGRGIIYTASLSGLTGKTESLQKFSFVGGVIVPISQSENSRFTAGLLLNIDPSVTIPILPILSYWHQFKHDIELNISLPQYIQLRKDVSKKVWAIFGSSLSSNSSFFRYDQSIIPKDFNYTVLGLQTGLGIEYRLTHKAILGISFGFETPFQARGFGVNEKSNNYFLKSSIGTAPYVNLSLSMLPFINSIF